MQTVTHMQADIFKFETSLISKVWPQKKVRKNIYTEDPCLMRLLGLGKSCISQIFGLCNVFAIYFITAIFFGLCVFWPIYFITVIFGPKIPVMK